MAMGTAQGFGSQQLALFRTSRESNFPRHIANSGTTSVEKKSYSSLSLRRKRQKGPGTSGWLMIENKLVHLGPSAEVWFVEPRVSGHRMTVGCLLVAFPQDTAGLSPSLRRPDLRNGPMTGCHCRQNLDQASSKTESWSLETLASGENSKGSQKQMLRVEDILSAQQGILNKAQLVSLPMSCGEWT